MVPDQKQMEKNIKKRKRKEKKEIEKKERKKEKKDRKKERKKTLIKIGGNSFVKFSVGGPRPNDKGIPLKM